MLYRNENLALVESVNTKAEEGEVNVVERPGHGKVEIADLPHSERKGKQKIEGKTWMWKEEEDN